MSTYFKYTGGESFTLDGNDYIGAFHILDSVPYTGIVHNTDSLTLESKNTFMSDIYIGTYELDNTYSNITSEINIRYSNTLDVLDKQGIDNILSNIDSNNVSCVTGLIISNPKIFNYSKNNNHFYGIESLDEDNSRSVPYKNSYSHILPFSSSSNWGFLDNVKVGIFTVDTYENFTYMCADEVGTYVLSGNFVNTRPLRLVSTVLNEPFYDVTYQIHIDTLNSRLVFVKNDFISIYDLDIYRDCGKLILVDKIALAPTSTMVYIWDTMDQSWEDVLLTWNDSHSTTNTNNPEFIKFGKNIRTSLVNNTLYIIDKYSSVIYQTLNLQNYGISQVVDIDIREIDDYVAILHKSEEDYLHLYVMDLTDDSFVAKSKLESIDTSRVAQKVRFSDIDSNIIYTYNDKEYQTRFISNLEYPSGRLEDNNFPYIQDYVWDTVGELWDYIPIKWNYDEEASDSYNNLLASTLTANNKIYMILHNVGRIFVLNQSTSEMLYNNIPMDLVKNFTGVDCSESSIGLYLNNSLSNVLKDVINIFNKNFGKFTLEERNVIVSEIEDINFNTYNLYINGNETVNVITLQRILGLITNIQSKLLPLSG